VKLNETIGFLLNAAPSRRSTIIDKSMVAGLSDQFSRKAAPASQVAKKKCFFGVFAKKDRIIMVLIR